MVMRAGAVFATAALSFAATGIRDAHAVEDIEYVAEHLAEIPMDNRFASLPVWGPAGEAHRSWSYVAQAAYAQTMTGNLEVSGPMLSAAASRSLSARWSLGTFVFYDPLNLSGNNDKRPLQTLFSPDTPFARPVPARFDHLDGTLRDYGAGVRVTLASENGWLGSYRLVGGVMWQREELRDFRLDYELLEGSDAGLRGQIDFDANYEHVSPFFGLELPRVGTTWASSPHVLAAWPNPRRGLVGHITGPGFDLHGDQDSAGNGTHFGDPSVTIGWDVTYLPAHFTIDVGTLITQRLVEPVIHKGIETNWLLSCQWRF
jgi:hypothetical protein